MWGCGDLLTTQVVEVHWCVPSEAVGSRGGLRKWPCAECVQVCIRTRRTTECVLVYIRERRNDTVHGVRFEC